MISQLSERQEDIRTMIINSRDATDKTMEEGLLASLGYDDDLIIAMVLAKLELQDPEAEAQPIDLMWASGMLDHLDTMGFRLRRKKRNG